MPSPKLENDKVAPSITTPRDTYKDIMGPKLHIAAHSFMVHMDIRCLPYLSYQELYIR